MTFKVYVKNLPKSSKFTIHRLQPCSKLVPGMCITFQVIFQTDVICDIQDNVTFHSPYGDVENVLLHCYCESPCLRIYVFKNVTNFTTKPLPDSPSLSYDVSRSAALNSVVDFGTCLLGSVMDVTLIMQNEGNTGTFFVMTENEWFNTTIKVSIYYCAFNSNLYKKNYITFRMCI